MAELALQAQLTLRHIRRTGKILLDRYTHFARPMNGEREKIRNPVRFPV
jgi:hypothetical protein